MNVEDPFKRTRFVRDVLLQRAAVECHMPVEGVESIGNDLTVHPDDVLARLEKAVRGMPADEVDDPDAFKAAFRTLLEYGDPALRKLLLPEGRAAEPRLGGDELASLEAIITADGSRPSFLLRGGTFAPDHPFLGTWQQQMEGFEDRLKEFSACVGRLQLPEGNATSYNGTGTLVPSLIDAERLVLTNFHVVQHARMRSGVQMDAHGGDKLTVRGDWVIDFCGETGSDVRNRWRVKEVRLPQGVDESFAGIDAAVLLIEPYGDESRLPVCTVTLSSDPSYARGEGSASLITIGFPGEPNTATPPGAKVDWNFVIKTLFNNRFGLKRAAPGRFKQGVGSVGQDRLGHVLSHDATTFGGASGSLLFAWREDPKQPAFALHFAGANTVANYAVSVSKVAEALRATGLKID